MLQWIMKLAIAAAVVLPAALMLNLPVAQAQEDSYRVYLPLVNVLDDGDNDGTFFSHYDPVFVVDIQNRVYVGETPPPDRTAIYAGGSGDLARYVANWPVGDYTGYDPANARRETQRGAPDGGYGSTAVQMEGFVAGMHLNSNEGSAGSQFAQLYYRFQSAPLPWIRGVNPRFCFDHDVAIPHSTLRDDIINYAYSLVAFVDTTTGKRLWILLSMYDSRSDVIDRGDILSWWAEAEEPIVYGYYGSSGYTSEMTDSLSSTSGTWNDWRYYGYCINYEQMQRMIQDANAQFDVGMNEDPRLYGVSSFAVGPESYNPSNQEAAVSMRVKDVRIFTLADLR